MNVYSGTQPGWSSSLGPCILNSFRLMQEARRVSMSIVEGRCDPYPAHVSSVCIPVHCRACIFVCARSMIRSSSLAGAPAFAIVCEDYLSSYTPQEVLIGPCWMYGQAFCPSWGPDLFLSMWATPLYLFISECEKSSILFKNTLKFCNFVLGKDERWRVAFAGARSGESQ